MPKKQHYTVTFEVTDKGQFDPMDLRHAIHEGIERMRNEGLLTGDSDETTIIGKHAVRHEDDNLREIIQELYNALDDASSVVDPGEDEPRAYDAVLKRAGSYLGIDSELIRA